MKITLAETDATLTLISLWRDADLRQRKARTEELELRSRIIKEVFGFDPSVTSPDDYAGTHYAHLPNGWSLKSENKIDYKLTNKNGETDKVLEDIPSHIAAMLVKWEPSLSVSVYKMLTNEQQKTLLPALTIKNATPSFSLVPPK